MLSISLAMNKNRVDWIHIFTFYSLQMSLCLQMYFVPKLK